MAVGACKTAFTLLSGPVSALPQVKIREGKRAAQALAAQDPGLCRTKAYKKGQPEGCPLTISISPVRDGSGAGPMVGVIPAMPRIMPGTLQRKSPRSGPSPPVPCG